MKGGGNFEGASDAAGSFLPRSRIRCQANSPTASTGQCSSGHCRTSRFEYRRPTAQGLGDFGNLLSQSRTPMVRRKLYSRHALLFGRGDKWEKSAFSDGANWADRKISRK